MGLESMGKMKEIWDGEDGWDGCEGWEAIKRHAAQGRSPLFDDSPFP
jgi:hypothetical protein